MSWEISFRGGPLNGRLCAVPDGFHPITVAAVVSRQGVYVADATTVTRGRPLAIYARAGLEGYKRLYRSQMVYGLERCDDQLRLTCCACGTVAEFATQQEAFDADWDVPGEHNEYLPLWPISCAECPASAVLDPERSRSSFRAAQEGLTGCCLEPVDDCELGLRGNEGLKQSK